MEKVIKERFLFETLPKILSTFCPELDKAFEPSEFFEYNVALLYIIQQIYPNIQVPPHFFNGAPSIQIGAIIEYGHCNRNVMSEATSGYVQADKLFFGINWIRLGGFCVDMTTDRLAIPEAPKYFKATRDFLKNEIAIMTKIFMDDTNHFSRGAEKLEDVNKCMSTFCLTTGSQKGKLLVDYCNDLINSLSHNH